MSDIKPPYISISWAEAFFELIKRIRLEKVDRRLIEQYNVTSPGNGSKVVSALKFLKILDKEGNIISDNLKELKLEGEVRQKGFRKIIEDAYSDLLNKIDLKQAKEEDIANYFIGNFGYSSKQSDMATKLFLHLANKSGIDMSKGLVTASQLSKRGRPKGTKKEIGVRVREKIKKPLSLQSREEYFSTQDEGSISISIRGNGINLDLSLKGIEDIKPNLDIVSQMLRLHLQKKKGKDDPDIDKEE